MAIFDRLHGQGKTIVLITHEDEIAAHARRVIRVRDGRIVLTTPATEPSDDRDPGDRVRRPTANKLRSALTILGLMIGVGSVIVLISVGNGSSTAVQKQIDALGSNVLMVIATPSLGGLGGARPAPRSSRSPT